MPLDLASRPRRLAAAGVDAFFNVLVLDILGVLVTEDPDIVGRIFQARYFGIEYRRDLIALAWIAAFAAMSVHAVLIAWRGQSVAKMLFGVRIVRADGRAPGLVHGVLLRYLPFTLLSLLPSAVAALRGSLWSSSWVFVLSTVVHLVDALMITGKGRCCLHDRLSDTRVIAIPATLSPVRSMDRLPSEPSA